MVCIDKLIRAYPQTGKYNPVTNQWKDMGRDQIGTETKAWERGISCHGICNLKEETMRACLPWLYVMFLFE